MFKLNKILQGQQQIKTVGRPVAKVTNQPSTLAECAALLKQQGAAVAVLAVQDLQAYWLKVMSDPKASCKDKLTASKLYAESIGAFAKAAASNKGPAVYHWGGVIDADIVANNSVENNGKQQT